MRKIRILFFLMLTFIMGNAQISTMNTLSEKEEQDGWKLLFNGSDFDGWKTFQGGEITGWKVINGVLNNSGVGSDHGGDIVTKKKYKNFELYIEWKIDPQSNSGIFYHVNEKVGKAIYESGPEYQLIDDKGWPNKLNDNQYSAANYAMHPPRVSAVKDVSEWNQTRIIVDGTHVQHYLNGELVVDYHLWDADWQLRKEKGKWKDFPEYGIAKTGNIGLQDHGGLAQFRNIKIREIK